MKNKSANRAHTYRIIFLTCIAAAVLAFAGYYATTVKKQIPVQRYVTVLSDKPYKGDVHHIFFHSLIVYPEKAATDLKRADLYRNNMITVEQFNDILQKLYENGYALIDSRLLYSVSADGKVAKKDLFMPEGKKPLVLSLDDLDYYSTMENGGMARKLVLENGEIRTEIVDPTGKVLITDDGDVVPIIDKFIKLHPDFSVNGAKGIIALTGYDGILGYRTQLPGAAGDAESSKALPVIDALKSEGWIFANHSYTHGLDFLTSAITSGELAKELALWKLQVEPLVGKTDIFVGPFGQVFKEGDMRRRQIVDAGYHILYGVGLDEYKEYFSDHLVINRINIDGLRLRTNPKTLHRLFGI